MFQAVLKRPSKAVRLHRPALPRAVTYAACHDAPGRPAPSQQCHGRQADDGYRDFYEVADPVLRRLGLAAMVFLTTDFVDGKDWLWFDKL